jgi:hypothetical protein
MASVTVVDCLFMPEPRIEDRRDGSGSFELPDLDMSELRVVQFMQETGFIIVQELGLQKAGYGRPRELPFKAHPKDR